MAQRLVANTPIVAALLPAVLRWCRRNQEPASRFLIPLSYATILGDTVTLIGTSTNLVVTGLIEKNLATNPCGRSGSSTSLRSASWSPSPAA